MTDLVDVHREAREAALKIFSAAGKPADGAGYPAMIAAFNAAAKLVETTPGIVEYTNPERQSNRGIGISDGTDFRNVLLEVAAGAGHDALRARAFECLGHISTRHFDFIRSFYDLEKLVPLVATAPSEEVTGAALGAFCRIAGNRNLRPAPPTKASQFQVPYRRQDPDVEQIEFRGGLPPHRKLNNGGTYAYDYASQVSYLEAAVALSAYVLRTSRLPLARWHAADRLRAIADNQNHDVPAGREDYRSLVRSFVETLKPRETDPRVLCVFEYIEKLGQHAAPGTSAGKQPQVALSFSL